MSAVPVPDGTHLPALYAVLRVAAAHPNLLHPKAFEELSDAIGASVPFVFMAVLLPDASNLRRLYAISRFASVPLGSFGARVAPSEALLAKVFGAGEVYRCDNADNGSDFERALSNVGRSTIAFPVRGDAGGSASRGEAKAVSVAAALLFTFAEAGGPPAEAAALLGEIVDILGASLNGALRLARERRLARILETSGDALLAWDRDEIITDANAAALRLTGRARDELIGAPLRELVGGLPEARPGPIELPHGGRIELSARGPDGTPARCIVDASFAAVEDDPLVAAHALLRDLTHVVAAEREAAQGLTRIRELEEQHRALLDNAPLIIFQLDADTGELVYLNRYAERLLGIPIAEALGTPRFLRDVHEGPEGVASFEQALADAREGASAGPYEARLRRRAGDAIMTRGLVYPVLSKQGAVVGIQGVLADISVEHAARTRLIQTDRLSTLGTLAAGVAHEINNSASHIVLSLGMMQRLLHGPQVRMQGTAAETAKMTLDELRESMQRIVGIVQDLRLFAGSRAGGPRLPIDVNRCVESAVNLTRGLIMARANIDVSLADVPQVVIDEGRLGQVIVSLLVNAVEAIPTPASRRSAGRGAAEAEGGAGDHRFSASSGAHQVTIETRSDGRAVEIEVRDTGAGIRAVDLSRIWAPFFTTKRPKLGSGLGLSISREIIDGAGGTIRAASPILPDGTGSSFTIRLPVEGHSEVTTPVTTPIPRILCEPKRVLVVDDEAPFRHALSRQLGRVHRVTVADSGEAALQLFDSGERFDVVLCDLRMPGMSGQTLFGRVREAFPEMAARFVFMTGVGFGAELDRFLADVGRPFLAKPFDTATAIETIAEVVTAAQPFPKEP